MNVYPHVSRINFLELETNRTYRFWLDLISDSLGKPISIPLIVIRGAHPGPILGLTAAVHGDELNGIPVIQRFTKELNTEELSGTVVGVPVMNLPSFIRLQRRYIDGIDLNHVMPGKPDGKESEVYVYRFVTEILSQFDYLIDLHTASEGRINSYYVRADLSNEVAGQLAYLQNPQIIVNNPPSDGTLRGAASAMSIPAITMEVGNPSTFQKGLIRTGITGLHNAAIFLEMIKGEIDPPHQKIIECRKSYWIYTAHGGLLQVLPDITDMVQKGEAIAKIHDIFGDKIAKYLAPENGIVIGKSVNPVNQTGGRILHLGIL
jgi:uncharacterized protein